MKDDLLGLRFTYSLLVDSCGQLQSFAPPGRTRNHFRTLHPRRLRMVFLVQE